MDNKIAYIKKGALLDIKISEGFVQQIQGVYDYLTKDLTKEEASIISTKIREKKPLDQREAALVTLSALVANIYEEAKASDNIYYKDLIDVVSETGIE